MADYDYETIPDKTAPRGVHYRVRRVKTDDRVATCYLEENARTVVAALNASGEIIHVVFDGPPGPEGPRFIEVETPDGRSISVGRWRGRGDGTWALVIGESR